MRRSNVVSRTQDVVMLQTKRRISTIAESGQKKKERTTDDILGNIFAAVSLGFIGLVIGWFYRGHRNSKAQKRFQTKLLDKSMLDNDEIIQMRLANKLNLKQFDELVRRVRIHYPNGVANPDEFFAFCANQLGGEYELNGKFKTEHLIERLVKSIKVSQKDSVLVADLDDLIIAFTSVLATEPKDTLRHIFNAFASSNGKDTDAVLKIEQLPKIVNSFRAIYQIPVRVQTHEIHEYPFNKYVLAETDRLIKDATETVKKEREKDKIERGIKNIEQGYMDEHDFIDLMLSKNICVWGECNSYRIGSTITSQLAASKEKQTASS